MEPSLANRSPEQNLINAFIEALQANDDDNLKISSIINTSCKSRKYADIEYISQSGQHWVIEAKTNDSSDAHNTVHKIFGELLKETGKENRNNCKYGILIPGSTFLLSTYFTPLQCLEFGKARLKRQ